jgi:hypothetical protein
MKLDASRPTSNVQPAPSMARFDDCFTALHHRVVLEMLGHPSARMRHCGNQHTRSGRLDPRDQVETYHVLQLLQASGTALELDEDDTLALALLGTGRRPDGTAPADGDWAELLLHAVPAFRLEAQCRLAAAAAEPSPALPAQGTPPRR